MMLVDMTTYVALFLAAFGAATLLPMQSEAVLAGLLALGDQSVWSLLTVATVGNTLGSIVNWVVGRSIEYYRYKRWFPVSELNLQRAQEHYHRYGHWSLLLSWLPIVGDPITLVAGVMREPLWRFILIVLLAKGGRYLVLAAMTLGLLN